MLDHLGLTSADLARSKAFFLQALAPLQIGVVMEVSAELTGDHDHVGFGSDGKPFFWLGNGGTASHGVHVAFARQPEALQVLTLQDGAEVPAGEFRYPPAFGAENAQVAGR